MLDINLVKKIKKLQKSNNFVLGGSLALFLQGYDLKRKFNDIDLVYSGHIKNFPYLPFLDIKDDLKSGDDSYGYMTYEGVTFEVLKASNLKTKKVFYKGISLKVQDCWEIFDIKYQYALKGYTKHAKDLYKISKIHSLDRNYHIKEVNEKYK